MPRIKELNNSFQQVPDYNAQCHNVHPEQQARNTPIQRQYQSKPIFNNYQNQPCTQHPSTMLSINNYMNISNFPHHINHPIANYGFRPNLPFISPDPKTNLELSEKNYRIAISIRPKYWDASINLAGLLSSLGRYQAALQVYNDIEYVLEMDYQSEERFEPITLTQSSKETDLKYFVQLFKIEQSRRKKYYSESVPSHATFSPERRRDLYFAKGNLYHVMGDFCKAKQEFLKSIASIGLDIVSLFDRPNCVPNPLVTAEQVYPNHSHPSNLATSNIVQTLAKMYQDSSDNVMAIKLYYLSLRIYPTANTCNNIGILLSPYRVDESIKWYELGLVLDANHVQILVCLILIN